MSAMAPQNSRRLDCLLHRLFKRKSNKTSKLRVTNLCGGNPLTKTSNTENVSIDDVIMYM